MERLFTTEEDGNARETRGASILMHLLSSLRLADSVSDKIDLSENDSFS